MMLIEYVAAVVFIVICIMLFIGAIYGAIKAQQESTNKFYQELRKLVGLIKKHGVEADKYDVEINNFCDAQGFSGWYVGMFSPEGERTNQSYLTFYKDEKEVLCLNIEDKSFFINGNTYKL